MPTNASLNGFYLWSDGSKHTRVQFPIRAGYFVPAKMPLNVTYPRPDIETNTFARHRWAHSQMEYQIPIVVQGGAWPFKYEIISAPAWLSIGQFYVDQDYGVLHGTPTTTGTHSIVIRVTGADGINFVDVAFSIQSDISNPTIVDSKFIFVQRGYAGTKVGTISQPLENINDWWGASVSNSTYHNKIIVFRAGTYPVVLVPAENSGNMRLQASTKTSQIIGFPNEEPIWDMTAAKILDDSNASNDLYISGITFINARNDVNNAHYFWIVGTSNRMTWWNNKFLDMSYGIVGDDNTGPIFIASTITVKNYLAIKHNYCENILNGGLSGAGNGTYFTIFKVSHCVIEENTVKNSDTGLGIYAKGTVAFVSIRANQLYENVSGIQLGLGYGAEAGEIPHDHEMCWNNVRAPDNVVMFANSPWYQTQTYNTYVYRNTFQGIQGTCRYPGLENFETDANILNFTNYTNWTESIQTSVIPNIKTALVNPAGELTRALGYGTHGWRPQ